VVLEIGHVVALELIPVAAIEVLIAVDAPQPAAHRERRRHGLVGELDRVARVRAGQLEAVVVAGSLQRQETGGAEEDGGAPAVVGAADVAMPQVGAGVRRVGGPDRAVHDGRIRERRPDERRARRDVPGHLRGPEVGGRVERELLSGHDAARRRDRLVVGDAVVRAEEPDAVLEEEAAEVRAVIPLVLSRRQGAGERIRIVGREDLVGAQPRAVVASEHAARKLVAARLRDDVDDAAGRVAVLRAIAVGLDLDLLDELVVDDLALQAADDVGRVDAVDDEAVLRGRRTVDRQRRGAALPIGAILGDARVRLDDVRVVAADRKAVDDSLAIGGPARRRAHVHDRRLARHHDLLGGRDLQRNRDGGRGVQPHLDLLLRLSEARQRHHHLVGAGRKRGELEGAAGARDRDAGALQRGREDLDGRPGQAAASRVDHIPADLSQGLGEESAGFEDEERCGNRDASADGGHGTLLSRRCVPHTLHTGDMSNRRRQESR
jgi:hypothetical protein